MLHDSKHKIKQHLLQQLRQSNAFWSYDPASISLENISDELMIEKTLIHLDIDDINKLFLVYPQKKIKEIWKANMIPQEPYYHGLNKMLAYLYFNISNPTRYIKTVCKQHTNALNKRADDWFSATYGTNI